MKSKQRGYSDDFSLWRKGTLKINEDIALFNTSTAVKYKNYLYFIDYTSQTIFLLKKYVHANVHGKE
jgi:hypothetical protein